jgi:tetratricopeptide (TPR) repeat protein
MRKTWSGVLVGAGLLLAGCDDLKKLAKGDPTPAERAQELIQAARKSVAAGDEPGAIKSYEAARALVANDPDIAVQLGKLYHSRGNDAAAILSLKRAIELSQDPEPHKLLAEIYMHQGRADQAAATLKEGGLEADGASGGGDLDAQLKLVRTLTVSGKVDEALALINKIQTNPTYATNADVFTAKAEVLMAHGQPEEAAKLLDAAVAGNPTSVDVRLARSRFLADRGMHDKALLELEKVGAADSARSDVVFAKARELAVLKRFDDAGTVLAEFSASHPNDIEGMATLAEVQLAAGAMDKARATAEAVLSRKPRDARALYVRGRCLEAGRENDRAVAEYQSALGAAPGHVPSLQRLWRLYESADKINDAISSLETLNQLAEASTEEQVELARLYSETGMNSKRGLGLLDKASQSANPPSGMDAIRRKLEVNAARDGNHGAPLSNGSDDHGVEIMKGHR